MLTTTPQLDFSDAGFRALEAERRVLTRFTPDPDRTLREWAAEHGRIADGSADGVPFDLSLVPYLAEPMDALTDPQIEETTVVKCTQAGATVGLILLLIAYHIDQLPARIMSVIPSVDEAEKWSKEKLVPMLDCTPRVRGRISEDRSRKSDQTILRKSFPGGGLTIVGANSGRGFRMVTMDIALGDDVDAWDPTAGAAGDQVTLIRKRVDRGIGRRLLWVSTPERHRQTGRSRIMELYDRSARHGRFHVPCPACGAWLVLRRGTRDTPFGLKWEEGRPETAAYLCEHCATLIPESEKRAMVLAGQYLTDEGEPVRDGRARTVGYWFNGFNVLLQGSEWPRLAEEWVRVQNDPVARTAVVNTVDAELFEEEDEELSAIEHRQRETWVDPAGEPVDVPAGAGLLSMSVDVQQTWVEAAVWGWGAGEECWLIYHERIQGDPEHEETFGRIEAIRTREWRHASGRTVRIWPVAVDARHLPHEVVYPYVRPLERAGVFAMLGHDTRARNILQRAQRPNKYGVRPWTVAVDAFKDALFARLKIRTPGPGYIHFPQPFDMGADAEFLTQFKAEVLDDELKNGRRRRRYKQIRRRNEAIDLYVLGLSALHALGPTVLASLGQRAEQWARPPEDGGAAATAPQKPGPPPRRGGWVKNWKSGGRP